MTALLRQSHHRVNVSMTKFLTDAECRRLPKRYRTILTQGGTERPDIPRRPNGWRGQNAKSHVHTLHKHLVKHEAPLPRFIEHRDVIFTNNAAEQTIRMGKVEIKMSG